MNILQNSKVIYPYLPKTAHWSHFFPLQTAPKTIPELTQSLSHFSPPYL